MSYRSILFIFIGTVLAASSASPAATLAPQILSLQAEAADLNVEVAWPAETETTSVKLLVLDAQGLPVASAPAWAAPGKTTSSTVPGALLSVAEYQLAYTLRLIRGEVDLIAPMPFRIELSCPKETSCHFVAIPGYELEGAVDLDPQLAAWLDEQGGGKVSLGEIEHPELRGAGYTYAMDLTAIGVQSVSDCVCTWTALSEAPAQNCTAIADLNPQDPTTTALHQFSTVSPEISLELQLRCLRLGDAEERLVETPAGRIAVPLPTLSPCDSPCIGTVTQDATGELQVEALADVDGRAEAMVDVTWKVDAVIQAFTSLQDLIDWPDSGDTEDFNLFAPLSVTATAPSRSTLSADVTAIADRLTVAEDAAALGRFSEAGLGSVGHATCALQPSFLAWLDQGPCPNKSITLLSGDRP
ncbi:MAG: hypothetical protein AAF657_36095 [Acidobacteriota bacterium]